MFCPNCGKDCGNANFCSHCGTRIQQEVKAEAKSAVWSVGQACPHCGGTKLEGNNCAFCGAQLMLVTDNQADSEQDLFAVPYASFPATIGNCVFLSKDAITLKVSMLFKTYRPRITFDRLKQVALRINDAPNSDGKITFSWERDPNCPPPKSRFISADQPSVYIPASERDLFFHLFWLLKYVVPEHVDFTYDIACSAKDKLENKLGRKIKWDDYVQQFTPYRDPAISAVCREHGLMRVDVEDIVHYTFEMHLCELYNADPSLAVRDVNLILQDRKRKQEEEKREREERRASRR